MPKQVNGFLANDGSFFENEPECQRHESQNELRLLCETHGINFENFMSMMNAWHGPVRRYFDADNNCKTPQAGSRLKFEDGGDDDESSIPAFLPTERDLSDFAGGDKDAPGFLEQQVRKY
jgi:hypothetical protein